MDFGVPDAVQRSPGDANGSRECAPDDRLRIVRCAAPLSRDLSRKDGPRISSATRALRCVRGTQQRHSSFPGASVTSEPENLFLLALLWRSKTVNHNLVCRGAVGRFALW